MHWRDRRQSHLKPASPHVVFADSNTTRARNEETSAEAGWGVPRRDGPMSVMAILRQLLPDYMHGIAFQTERNACMDRGATFGLRVD